MIQTRIKTTAIVQTTEGEDRRTKRKNQKTKKRKRYKNRKVAESQTSGVRLPRKARSMISSAPKWKGRIGFALSHRARASTESS